jgi:hypothetical protein
VRTRVKNNSVKVIKRKSMSLPSGAGSTSSGQSIVMVSFTVTMSVKGLSRRLRIR